METPETEDCEKESNLIEHNGNYYVRCETHEEVIRRLQEKHEEALSFRDTYWKERVRKDVKDAYEHAEIVRQRTLNEIRQAVEDDESYGGAKECVYKILDRY